MPNSRSSADKSRFSRAPRAQALVETALVLPIFMIMFLGVVGLGQLTHAQMAVSAVAHEAARTGALADTSGQAQSNGEARGYDVGKTYNLARPGLEVHVDPGQFGRCGSVTAHVVYPLTFQNTPFLNWARITIHADDTEPVDGYRSQVSSTKTC